APSCPLRKGLTHDLRLRTAATAATPPAPILWPRLRDQLHLVGGTRDPRRRLLLRQRGCREGCDLHAAPPALLRRDRGTPRRVRPLGAPQVANRPGLGRAQIPDPRWTEEP